MKIYLAGLEAREKQVRQAGGTDYALTSFFFLRGKGEAAVDRIRSLVHKSWLIDSGAFTFMNSGGTVNWENYVDDYAAFVNRYQVDLFIELDLYSVIGIGKTEALRKRLERKTNKQCIPVFHPELGVPYYKKMVAGYPYVALGGIVVGKWKNYKQMVPLIDYANCRGVKIHGLGFTRMAKLDYMNFYSVDSTSWVGDRYGKIYIFDGRNLKGLSLGGSGRKLEYKRAALINVQQWNLYQAYMDSRGSVRGNRGEK